MVLLRIGVNLLTCNREAIPELRLRTQATVISLLESDLTAPGREAVWAVVDNGSDDYTVPWLRQVLPVGSFVYEAGKNLGIAAGRNIGTRYLLAAGADLVLEVHNDMLFPRRWLYSLLDLLDREPRAGLVSPGLIVGRGPVLYAPLLALPPTLSIEEQVRRLEEKLPEAIRPDTVRPGLQHPALKRASMLRKIGLYDEGFFPRNFEDTDEAYRMFDAAFDHLVDLRVAVWHHYSFSYPYLPDRPNYSEQEGRFAAKWGPKAATYGKRMRIEYDGLYAR